MKEQIVKNISRLSLHDSHIEKIERTESKLILILDWAKLENYSETDMHEGVILGNCQLTFEGLDNESFKLDFTEEPGHEGFKQKEIDFNDDLFNNWQISDNKVENENLFHLNGLLVFNNKYGWLDWTFLFKEFKLTWNSHITWEDWKKGKLVNE